MVTAGAGNIKMQESSEAGMSATENREITRAAGVTGIFTLASRILGLVRDQVVAYLFGAGWAADAFFVAFRLPNLLRRLSAEGAMQAAFVPVYTQTLVQDGPAAARRTASAAFGLLAVILALISAGGVLGAPWLIRVIAPGFIDQPDKFALTVTLTRIVFPYIFFISLATLLMSQLNALGRFAVPAAAPVGLNICIIGTAFALGPHLERPVYALAVGVMLGGVVQLVMQYPPLIRLKALPGPVWRPGDERLKLMIRRMGPVIFGAAVYQINLLIGTLLASLLASGSVSYLYYADRLVQFPLGVFGVALSTAILPSLSRQAARGDTAEFVASAGHGLGLSLFIILPSAVGLALLARPLVGLIYQHGAFDHNATVMTARALWAFAPGLPMAGLAAVVIRIFNAQGDTRTPAVMAAWSMAANVVLSLVLMGPLNHAGLALASSLATGVNLVLLVTRLKTRHPEMKGAGLLSGWLPITLNSALMGAALTAAFLLPASPLAAWPDWAVIAVGVPLGAAIYFGLAAWQRSPQLAEVRGVVLRRGGR